MSKVLIENHDFLGKLTVIKNILAVILEKGNDNQDKKLLKHAFEATEDLIQMTKKTSS